MKKTWKWILFALVLIALIAASRMLPLTAWLKSFNQWVAGLGPGGVVIFIVVYVIATVLFAPGSILTIGAGFVFGLSLGVVAVSIGSVIGASLAFLISRYLARSKIESLANKNEKFKAVDRAIGEQGWKLVFLLRLSPLIPFSLSNYLYGLTAVRFWSYVLASWIGMLPGTVLYVYLGAFGKAGFESAAGERTKSPAEWAFLVIGLIATLAVTLWVTKIARDAIKKTAA
jgi:uncharacterized membrane protein YdjX (TVP38/TMEM64 family)